MQIFSNAGRCRSYLEALVRVVALLCIAATAACNSGILGSPDQEATSSEVRPPKKWSAAVRFEFHDTLRSSSGPGNAWSPVVRVSDGDRAWTVSEHDVATRWYASPHSPWYRTRDRDSLTVDVLLAPRAGHADTTHARAVVPLKADNAWEFLITISERDLREYCIGCAGVAFPLHTTNGDASPAKLWIVWTGSPISRMTVAAAIPRRDSEDSDGFLPGGEVPGFSPGGAGP